MTKAKTTDKKAKSKVKGARDGVVVDSHKPLRGRAIFLHLHGYRGAAKFEENIKILGATIEKCFSREVNILITSLGTAKDYERSRTKGLPTSAASPATPSPFNLASIKGLESPQPDSPGEAASKKPLTRGQSIALAATKSRTLGSSDIISNAKKWAIKTIHIDQAQKYVLREMEKVPESARKPQPVKKDSKEAKPKHKVKRLQGSYIKFESCTRHYRPLTQTFKSLPTINTNTPFGTCPFELPKKGQGSLPVDRDIERAEREERDKHGAEEEEDGAGLRQLEDPDTANTGELRSPTNDNRDDSRSKVKDSNKTDDKLKAVSRKSGQGVSSCYEPSKLFTKGELRRIMMDKIRAEMKRGFCEACEVKYEDIDKHVRSDQHRRFARDSSNYTNLDELIVQGPNMEQFLNDVVKYQDLHQAQASQESQDGVLLLTEMTSPDVLRQATPRRGRACNQDPGNAKSATAKQSLRTTPSKRSLATTPSKQCRVTTPSKVKLSQQKSSPPKWSVRLFEGRNTTGKTQDGKIPDVADSVVPDLGKVIGHVRALDKRSCSDSKSTLKSPSKRSRSASKDSMSKQSGSRHVKNSPGKPLTGPLQKHTANSPGKLASLTSRRITRHSQKPDSNADSKTPLAGESDQVGTDWADQAIETVHSEIPSVVVTHVDDETELKSRIVPHEHSDTEAPSNQKPARELSTNQKSARELSTNQKLAEEPLTNQKLGRESSTNHKPGKEVYANQKTVRESETPSRTDSFSEGRKGQMVNEMKSLLSSDYTLMVDSPRRAKLSALNNSISARRDSNSDCSEKLTGKLSATDAKRLDAVCHPTPSDDQAVQSATRLETSTDDDHQMKCVQQTVKGSAVTGLDSLADVPNTRCLRDRSNSIKSDNRRAAVVAILDLNNLKEQSEAEVKRINVKERTVLKPPRITKIDIGVNTGTFVNNDEVVSGEHHQGDSDLLNLAVKCNKDDRTLPSKEHTGKVTGILGGLSRDSRMRTTMRDGCRRSRRDVVDLVEAPLAIDNSRRSTRSASVSRHGYAEPAERAASHDPTVSREWRTSRRALPEIPDHVTPESSAESRKASVTAIEKTPPRPPEVELTVMSPWQIKPRDCMGNASPRLILSPLNDGKIKRLIRKAAARENVTSGSKEREASPVKPILKEDGVRSPLKKVQFQQEDTVAVKAPDTQASDGDHGNININKSHDRNQGNAGDCDLGDRNVQLGDVVGNQGKPDVNNLHGDDVVLRRVRPKRSTRRDSECHSPQKVSVIEVEANCKGKKKILVFETKPSSHKSVLVETLPVPPPRSNTTHRSPTINRHWHGASKPPNSPNKSHRNIGNKVAEVPSRNDCCKNNTSNHGTTDPGNHSNTSLHNTTDPGNPSNKPVSPPTRRNMRIKLRSPWRVASKRSISQLFSEDDEPDFAGFDSRSQSISDLPSDMSYEEVSEVDVSERSGEEWVIEEQLDIEEDSEDGIVEDGIVEDGIVEDGIVERLIGDPRGESFDQGHHDDIVPTSDNSTDTQPSSPIKLPPINKHHVQPISDQRAQPIRVQRSQPISVQRSQPIGEQRISEDQTQPINSHSTEATLHFKLPSFGVQTTPVKLRTQHVEVHDADFSSPLKVPLVDQLFQDSPCKDSEPSACWDTNVDSFLHQIRDTSLIAKVAERKSHGDGSRRTSPRKQAHHSLQELDQCIPGTPENLWASSPKVKRSSANQSPAGKNRTSVGVKPRNVRSTSNVRSTPSKGSLAASRDTDVSLTPTRIPKGPLPIPGHPGQAIGGPMHCSTPFRSQVAGHTGDEIMHRSRGKGKRVSAADNRSADSQLGGRTEEDSTWYEPVKKCSSQRDNDASMWFDLDGEIQLKSPRKGSRLRRTGSTGSSPPSISKPAARRSLELKKRRSTEHPLPQRTSPRKAPLLPQVDAFQFVSDQSPDPLSSSLLKSHSFTSRSTGSKKVNRVQEGLFSSHKGGNNFNYLQLTKRYKTLTDQLSDRSGKLRVCSPNRNTTGLSRSLLNVSASGGCHDASVQSQGIKKNSLNSNNEQGLKSPKQVRKSLADVSQNSEQQCALFESPKKGKGKVHAGRSVVHAGMSSPDLDSAKHVVPKLTPNSRMKLKYDRRSSPKSSKRKPTNSSSGVKEKHVVPKITPNKKAALISSKSSMANLDNSNYKSPPQKNPRKRKISVSDAQSPGKRPFKIVRNWTSPNEAVSKTRRTRTIVKKDPYKYV